MARRGRPRKNERTEREAEVQRHIDRIRVLEDRLERLKSFETPPILPSRERTIVLGSLFTFAAIFASGLGVAVLLPPTVTGRGMKMLFAISALACAWIAGRELRKAMHKAGHNW